MIPADALWFRKHPHRRHRLRPALPGETGSWVLVRQMRPGFRVRAGIELAKGVLPADDELTAKELFEEVARMAAARPILYGLGLAFAEPEGRA
jgi:hypothetical protein